MSSWIWSALEQLWSFVAVALAVHAFGRVSKRIADRFGWRRYRRSDIAKLVSAARGMSSGDVPLPRDATWYDLTLRLHPVIAGALFGFLPLPSLNVIDALPAETGQLLAARCAWFMLAGALCGQVYEAVKFAFTEGRARIFGIFGKSADAGVSSGNEDR